MKSKQIPMITLLALSCTSCFNIPVLSTGVVNNGIRAGATNTTTLSKSVSAVDANSTSEVKLTAPVMDGMEGASVTIPPGSLGLSIDLVLEQAANFSDSSMASEMALGDDIQITAASPGIIVRPSESVELKKPMTLAMPIPAMTGLNLKGSRFAIIYKYFDPAEQKLLIGIKVEDGVNVRLGYDETTGKDTLTFEGYFGAYWATVLNRAVVASEVPVPRQSQEPIVNKLNVAVIATTGVVKETDVVKVQSVPELSWSKPSLKFVNEPRSITLVATVPAGRSVRACKADLYESTASISGISLDASDGPSITYPINGNAALNLIGRFRCVDTLGRSTTTPWSDLATIPAVNPESKPVPPGAIANSLSGRLVPPTHLMAIRIRPGHSNPEMREVMVDANGNFKVDFVDENALVERVRTMLNMSPIPRNDMAFINDIGALFNEPSAGVIAHFASLPVDSDLRADMIPEVDQMLGAGIHSMLVSYIGSPNGSFTDEALSFKFVSLLTPSGTPLTIIPAGSLKGSFNLGELKTDGGEEMVSTIAAAQALNETAEVLEGLALKGRASRTVRNFHMNSQRASAFYTWSQELSLSNLTGTHSLPQNMDFKGYGFHVDQGPTPPFTIQDICSSTRRFLAFEPPIPVTYRMMNADYSATSFDNVGTMTEGMENGFPYCHSAMFYARADNHGIFTSFGSGGTITSQMPVGLWRLKIDGAEIGRFSFSGFQPYDAGNLNKAKIPVPSIKLIQSGSQYIAASVKFSRFENGVWVPVPDASVLARYMNQFHISLRGSGGMEHRARLDFTPGSMEATATFNDVIMGGTVHEATVEFEMGDQSYRFNVVPPI